MSSQIKSASRSASTSPSPTGRNSSVGTPPFTSSNEQTKLLGTQTESEEQTATHSSASQSSHISEEHKGNSAENPNLGYFNLPEQSSSSSSNTTPATDADSQKSINISTFFEVEDEFGPTKSVFSRIFCGRDENTEKIKKAKLTSIDSLKKAIESEFENNQEDLNLAKRLVIAYQSSMNLYSPVLKLEGFNDEEIAKAKKFLNSNGVKRALSVICYHRNRLFKNTVNNPENMTESCKYIMAFIDVKIDNTESTTNSSKPLGTATLNPYEL